MKFFFPSYSLGIHFTFMICIFTSSFIPRMFFLYFIMLFSLICKNFLIESFFFFFFVLHVYFFLSNALICFICSLPAVFPSSNLIFRHVDFSLVVSNISIKYVILFFGSQLFPQFHKFPLPFILYALLSPTPSFY